MRIVFILGSANTGGTELNTLRLARALKLHGHEVTQILIGRPGTLTAAFDSSGVEVVQVPSRSLRHPTIVRTVQGIVAILRARNAHVVHSHDIYGNIIGVPAARLARVPIVVSSRRWWDAVPGVTHRLLNRVAYSLSTTTVANARSVARMLIENERLRSTSVRVVPNIVNEDLLTTTPQNERLVLRQELQVPHDATVIMCIARLVPVKNHGLLIRAFASMARRMGNLRLVLVGDGPSRTSLEQLTVQLGVESQTTFCGERSDAGLLYRAADIAVLTSDSEGMPNSLLEAMACGLPIVSSNVGGCVDLVKSEDTGILFERGSQTQLESALIRLIKSPQTRTKMGDAGMRLISQDHSASSVIRALEQVYGASLNAHCQ